MSLVVKTFTDYMFDMLQTTAGRLLAVFVVLSALALYVLVIYLEVVYGQDDTDG